MDSSACRSSWRHTRVIAAVADIRFGWPIPGRGSAGNRGEVVGIGTAVGIAGREPGRESGQELPSTNILKVGVRFIA